MWEICFFPINSFTLNCGFRSVSSGLHRHGQDRGGSRGRVGHAQRLRGERKVRNSYNILTLQFRSFPLYSFRSWNGKRYGVPGNEDIVLMYDVNGYIAGVQVG